MAESTPPSSGISKAELSVVTDFVTYLGNARQAAQEQSHCPVPPSPLKTWNKCFLHHRNNHNQIRKHPRLDTFGHVMSLLAEFRTWREHLFPAMTLAQTFTYFLKSHTLPLSACCETENQESRKYILKSTKEKGGPYPHCQESGKSRILPTPVPRSYPMVNPTKDKAAGTFKPSIAHDNNASFSFHPVRQHLIL